MRAFLQSPYKYAFATSLLIYLITAFFSEGYYHPDEHFQILEFCNYKLGFSPAADLPWEFTERIRPALQPALAWLIIKFLLFVRIPSPFTWALWLRIISAICSWFISVKLCTLLVRDFSTDAGKKIFIYLNFFLWFMPFISVRFSSENYAGITFLGAVYLILRYIDMDSRKKLWPIALAGLLLGFSFFFRFQMAFSILGLGMWLVFIKKVRIANLFTLILSGIGSILVCLYLDYWFYGSATLTPVNYFIANIIEHKAAHWGISPWWSYFSLFFSKGAPPISLLLLIFFFIGIFRRPVHILTWCFVPFLLGHFMVDHKEIRFMFPMIFSFIYISAIGIDDFITTRKWQKAGRVLLIVSVVINIPLLMVTCLRPAQEAISYFRFLYQYPSNNEVILLSKEKNAYNLVDLNANFYRSPHVKCVVYHDDQDISDYLNRELPDSILLLERNIGPEDQYSGYQNNIIYCLYPKWIFHFNFDNWLSRSRVWQIRELRKVKYYPD